MSNKHITPKDSTFEIFKMTSTQFMDQKEFMKEIRKHLE